MTDVTPDEARQIRQAGVDLVAAYSRGELSLDAYYTLLASLLSRAQGIAEPTAEQIAERAAELRTAASFISSAPTPNN
ncbi:MULTISPECIES: hypothetical protein [Mycobacterium]|uniref:hypothetical protein n=1 Tax=Mycobacterium TaxID=1763 RepID=UPI0004D84C97|nr:MULTISPECIES: hypothetical protein [Mycobacterium]KEF95170.1 hypothetical protein K883_05126 [Mycobacterium sp. TKK-01-0059]OCB20606.1 hypothetical protein A5644_02170 [Mycobacterium intracellulare subsp. yongonense]